MAQSKSDTAADVRPAWMLPEGTEIDYAAAEKYWSVVDPENQPTTELSELKATIKEMAAQIAFISECVEPKKDAPDAASPKDDTPIDTKDAKLAAKYIGALEAGVPLPRNMKTKIAAFLRALIAKQQ